MTESAQTSPPAGGSPSASPNAPSPSGHSGTPADEFAGIPGPRRSRHPLLAGAAVALAALLAWQLRADLGYALSPATVRDLGDARALAATPLESLPINRHVRLRGLADRESAVILDTQGSWQFAQFFRLLTGDGRIFVRRVADPLPSDLADRDVFTGRLIRFADLSFEAAIRQHFAAHVSATHVFRPEALARALGAGPPLTISDMAGVKVTLAAGDEISVDHVQPGELRIEFPRDRYSDPAAARAAVERHGGKVVEAITDRDRQRLIASFPVAGREAAAVALADLDRRVRVAPARRTIKVRLADVAMAPEGLTVALPGTGKRVLPLAQIPAVRTLASLQVPANAILLLEGDKPRDHLRTVIVLFVLAAFAAVNLLALRRAA